MSKCRPYAAIVTVGSALYFKTLFFGFTYLDDNVLILKNFHFLSSLSNLPQAFRQDVFHALHGGAAYYRPILVVSFMLDTWLGRSGGPFIYHFTNVVIHLAASCLAFLFLTKLGITRRFAFLLALFFTVHPVLTQAAAWIPGRNDSLMALFGLAAFIFFLDFLETKRMGYYLAHNLFFALALFTKETALALIAMCGLYYWLIKAKGEGHRAKGREGVIGGDGGRVKWVLAGGWLAVSASWLILRAAAFTNPIPMTFLDMARSVVMNSPAVIQYIGKAVFPFNLSVLPMMRDTGFGLGIAGTAVLAAAILFSKRSGRRLIIFGAAWFLAFLVPSFIRPDLSTPPDFIEHRMYMPLVGFLIAVSGTAIAKRLEHGRRPDLAAAVLVIGFFAAITFFHSGNFRDRLSFWKNAARTSPHSPLAHRNLGAMHYLDGRLDEAEALYRRSLELNPLEPMANNNLGLIFMQNGQFNRAELFFLRELSFNPDYDDANFNLGLLYYKLGRKDEAGRLWEKTLEINPGHKQALECRGKIY